MTNTTLTRRKTFENQPFGHIIDTKKRLESIWRIRNNKNRRSSYKSLAWITFGNNFSSMPRKKQSRTSFRNIRARKNVWEQTCGILKFKKAFGNRHYAAKRRRARSGLGIGFWGNWTVQSAAWSGVFSIQKNVHRIYYSVNKF